MNGGRRARVSVLIEFEAGRWGIGYSGVFIGPLAVFGNLVVNIGGRDVELPRRGGVLACEAKTKTKTSSPCVFFKRNVIWARLFMGCHLGRCLDRCWVAAAAAFLLFYSFLFSVYYL
jgi:hypothetical protein